MQTGKKGRLNINYKTSKGDREPRVCIITEVSVIWIEENLKLGIFGSKRKIRRKEDTDI